MPWSNQSGGGGPWGGGGGNNGGNGGGGGPWGGGGSGPGRGGNQPPNLEDLLRRGQEQFRNVVPGGGGSAAIVAIVAIVIAAFYLFKSVYTIQPDQLGVELLFGKPKQQISEPGLHFNFWPFEHYEVVNIRENQMNIGRSETGGQNSGLMLSSDQNIVVLSFSVLYQVTDPQQYLFNVSDPDEMLRQVSESAMREVVGRRPAQDVFRDDRAGVAEAVRTITQNTMDEYKAGVRINAVSIEDVAPPGPVADSYDEVQRAEQDEDRFVEEANRYSNKELGQARGEAAQIIEDAAAYKNRIVEEAKGEAARFISVYDEYKKAPDVTRKRIYLETMENVLGKSDKVIIDQGGKGQGVVPYLPLPQLQKQDGNRAKIETKTGASQ